MTEFEDRVSRDLHRACESVEPPSLLWRRVEDRIGRPRDRRAIAVLALAAVTVVAVAVLAVALHDSGGSEKHVASESPSTTESPGIVVPIDQTTASVAPSTSVVTTTSRPTTTTTTMPVCLADDLAFVTLVDHPSYDSTTPVVFRGEARNVSTRSCLFIHDKCSTASVYEDARGTIWDSSGYDPNLSSCLFPHLEDVLAPGQAINGPTWSWDHRTCSSPPPTTTSTIASSRPCDGPPASPGHYHAAASWSFGDYNAYSKFGYPPWEFNPASDNGQTIYVYNGKNDAPSAPFDIS